MTRVLVRPSGLRLDENAVAPMEGALRRADNVVCDQPGVVRARQTNDVELVKNEDRVPAAMIVHGSDVLVISTEDDQWTLESEATVHDLYFDPPSATATPRLMAARGSVYYAAADGMRRYDGIEASLAGVEPWLGPLLGGSTQIGGALGSILTGGPLPTPLEARIYFHQGTTRVGDVFEWYKTIGDADYAVFLVVKRTDVNGYVRRSPPTRVGARGANVPLLDAYLWRRHTITADELADGYIVNGVATTITVGVNYISPEIDDDSLGEALYTNGGQGGALSARHMPPIATEFCAWSGVTWYANAVGRRRLLLSISNVTGAEDATALSEDFGGLLGAITVSPWQVDAVSGNTTCHITNDDASRAMRVGQYITDATAGPSSAGAVFQADTRIVSWTLPGGGGVDVVVDKAATSTATVDVFFGDVVEVDGRLFYAWAGAGKAWSPDLSQDLGRRCFGIDYGTGSFANARAAATLAAAINYESIVDSTFLVRASLLGDLFSTGSSVDAPATLLLEEIGMGGPIVTVDTSCPEAFDAAMPATLDRAEDPGIVWFSLPDEPEAVPLANFVVVGQRTSRVVALVPSREGMFVFKEDGLFRITGLSPNRWRIDSVDSDCRLLHPNCVATIGSDVFAWTSFGVARCYESSVDYISGPIDRALVYGATRAVNGGSWLCGWGSVGLLLVHVGGGATPTGTEESQVFSYSVDTSAWTRFFRREGESLACANYDVTEDAFRVARASLWEIRLFSNQCNGHEASYLLPSVTSVAPYTTITHASATIGSWVPQVGDWIERDNVGSVTYARISAIALSSGTYTFTLDRPIGASGGEEAWTAYEGLECVVDWQQTGPQGSWELVREMQIHVDSSVDDAESPARIHCSAGGSSSLSSAPAVTTAIVDAPTSFARPYRFGVPRSVGRSPQFFPRISINAFGFPWRMNSLVVIGAGGSEKVRK